MSTRMSSQAYLWVAGIFMLLIPFQFYFAAAGTFSVLGFTPHIWLGLGLHALSALLIVIALVGRLPRRALEWSFLQFILISLQVGLTRLQFPDVTVPIEPQFLTSLIHNIMQPVHDAMGSGAGIIAALHGVNGLAIVGVGILTIRYARTLNKESMWFGSSAGASRHSEAAATRK
jgi:hypothetical protein